MSGHEHTNRCYWDYLEAQWQCRPAREEAEALAATEFPAVVVAAETPVAAAAAELSR